ncbi:MAG TPA: tetratricopeptide repeat protein, partial [Pyrinomonadaceae bacterium]|nr:tetratricopeptide repeat protein [Pyrinomonadaceae bacterium]
MQPNGINFYCQRCLAANPFGQEHCGRCGTRLMLVVEPPAARYEDDGLTASDEEHLLERVSVLENRLTRMTERLEQVLDLLLRQARNSYLDHTLVETLIGVLSEAGTVEAGTLDELWRARCQRDAAEQDDINRREELRARVIAHYRGAERAAFEQQVNEGIGLLGEEEITRGIRTLERAAALAPDNVPLLSFIGEHFFRSGKTALARDYLARAFKAAPDDYGVCLLLGLACGDEGETEQAKELLSDAMRRGGESFAAHYGLGRLLA